MTRERGVVCGERTTGGWWMVDDGGGGGGIGTARHTALQL
jgi:hypothetical protein